MIKIILAAVICYIIYKFCEAKGYDLPTMAWFGVGVLVAWALALM